jgi:hypothetical protein
MEEEIDRKERHDDCKGCQQSLAPAEFDDEADMLLKAVDEDLV